MESFNQEFSLFKATLKKFCPNTAILSELLELTQKKYIKLFTCLFFSQLPSWYEKSKVQDTASLSTTCVIQDSDKPQGVFQFPHLVVSKAAPEGQIHRHKGTSRSQTCQCNKAQRQSNTLPTLFHSQMEVLILVFRYFSFLETKYISDYRSLNQVSAVSRKVINVKSCQRRPHMYVLITVHTALWSPTFSKATMVQYLSNAGNNYQRQLYALTALILPSRHTIFKLELMSFSTISNID